MKQESETHSRANKHQLRREATVNSLLEAAEKVFVRDGYERAQMETIAAEAGRTKGAVYTYYRTKEQIFFAVLETRAQNRLDTYIRSTAGIPFDRVVTEGRRLFLATMEEKDWPILMLEFKLYTLRNKGSLKRTRVLYRLVNEEASRDILPDELAFTPEQKRKALIALGVLRGLPSAITLERHFNPMMRNKTALGQVLGTIYDAMVAINH